MINLSYTVAGQLIEPASVPQYLVADTVGVYQVVFTFDADWDTLGEKKVVFRNPQVIDPDYRDVPVEFPLDANGQALVPAALLDPGKLFIGVYGTNSTQQFPTIWAPPLQVVPGASPGVEPSDDPALGTVIRTIPQTLTEEEKTQARENIGANEIEGGTPGNVVIIDNNNNISDSGVSLGEILPNVTIEDGNIIEISDGMKMPFKQLEILVPPYHSQSSLPYTFTKLSYLFVNFVKGKNLFGGLVLAEQFQRAMAFHRAPDTTNKTTRVESGSSNTNVSMSGGLMAMRFKERTEYTIILTAYHTNTSTPTNIRVYYTDGTYSSILFTSPVPTTIENAQTIVFYTNPAKTVAMFTKSSDSGATYVLYEKSGIFEGHITADEFVPYEGGQTVITLSTDVDVYGGKWYPLEGRFLNFAYIESFSGQTLGYPVMSSIDGYMESGTPTTGATVIDYGTTTEILVAPIAQECDTQMTVWAGVNYNFTINGVNPIDMIYCADPSIILEQKTADIKAIKQSIAYVQNDFTAVQPYVVNDLVYVGDTLYIVTSAISSGATITPNTNCSETTLNAVIKSLR